MNGKSVIFPYITKKRINDLGPSKIFDFLVPVHDFRSAKISEISINYVRLFSNFSKKRRKSEIFHFLKK